MNAIDQDTPLWKPGPERIKQAGITRFRQWVNAQYGTDLGDYTALWHWSIEDVGRFWEAIALHYQVFERGDYGGALADQTMPGASWFPGTRLNFAQYLLRQGEGERVAVYAESESAGRSQLHWGGLREQVARLASHLRASGVRPGDHVCAYLPISAEAVVALLASVSVGAVWSSCSPDFGSKSVHERFSQVAPKVLIAVSGYHYNGKNFDRSAELRELIDTLPSLAEVIYLPWTDRDEPRPPRATTAACVTPWQTALDNSARYADFIFEPLPFDHPLWVLYTSGTTGLPKGIVHGHGGVLLEFIKTGWLHDDLNPDSVKFFFTTTGWTMFNLLVGGLVTGGSIVVYDGCPTWPGPGALFEIAERSGVTYFGASPTFVHGLMAREYSPGVSLDLSRIRTVALTGSPSAPETFRWFYDNLHPDLHVVSMSGGTDVVAAFVGGAPILPVHAGEIQAPCLGVAAWAFDEQGNSVIDEDGELVITRPMPSMPLYLLNDPGNKRYLESYFDTYPGIWRQGDLIRFKKDGRCIISGRSDSTLNRYGIRVGTAEIYRTVEAIEGIADSLIVNLELPGARFFMPLFVVLKEGTVLNDGLVATIANALKTQCSPRHIPDKVYAVEEVPYTLSGKKLEVPVKKLLSGKPLASAVNLGAVRNPQALDYFVEFALTLDRYQPLYRK
jgi:acetoacetyl-CoA synthetase